MDKWTDLGWQLLLQTVEYHILAGLLAAVHFIAFPSGALSTCCARPEPLAHFFFKYHNVY